MKLGPSKIPNSGEGVIAVRDIPRTRMAALYSLFLYQIPDQNKLYNQVRKYILKQYWIFDDLLSFLAIFSLKRKGVTKSVFWAIFRAKTAVTGGGMG